MKAIISDIHGNLEALNAVLADIARHPVEATYCLGDVVGYGPNPRECFDLIMRCRLVLLGNHEDAALFTPSSFRPAARRAVAWSRTQLDAPIPDHQAANRRLSFLRRLPVRHREDRLLFVHASPRDPAHEYVCPGDIDNPRKMSALFAQVDGCCFLGHTHLPGVFTESREFFAPAWVDHAYRLDDRKTLCNVGSVGQPRDGDWRACYVLLDGPLIRFRRIEYDVDLTIRKIRQIPHLHDSLAERLRRGR
jgi:diadenosine tetraphosphatase ApaH/serine/threonine PP2A family protein phosphatase